MLAFCRRHGLGITLAALWLASLIAAVLAGATLADLLANYSGDAFGALLIVMLTKWLIERGSSQSKDNTEC